MAHKRSSGETWSQIKIKTGFTQGQVFNLKYFDFISHLPQLYRGFSMVLEGITCLWRGIFKGDQKQVDMGLEISIHL